MPDRPLPPNGAPRSRTKKQLTQTVPASSAALDPLGALGVAGDQGRGEPETGVVGQRTASSSVAKVWIVSTGPNTSSVRISLPGAAPAKIVGSK